MKITLLTVGETADDYLEEGIKKYEKRLKNYIPFSRIELKINKLAGKNPGIQKKEEGSLILNHLKSADQVILLDESGKEQSSVDFSNHLQRLMNSSARHVIFVVGGAYGFSDEVYERSRDRISLSKMTFSHQMVRLVFVEQLYRAFTIIRNEKYHHV